MPDTRGAWQALVHVMKHYPLDFRSLVSTALHSHPGYRNFVIRVKGERAEALVNERKAKCGDSLSVLII